ncbi:hypothetical protein A2U01_0103706, partial [Trifolium medium]|nr:hypothetical protein [Trifolium medium]
TDGWWMAGKWATAIRVGRKEREKEASREK